MTANVKSGRLAIYATIYVIYATIYVICATIYAICAHAEPVYGSPLSDRDLVVPFHFPFHILLPDILALVIELFAPCQADLDLDPSVFEVDLQGHQGIALGLDLAGQLEDLSLVQEQAAFAQGLTVEDIALFIGADVHALNESFSVINGYISFFDAAFAHTDRLDLGSEKLDPAFVFFFYKVIVVGLLVVGYQLHRFSRHDKTLLLLTCVSGTAIMKIFVLSNA